MLALVAASRDRREAAAEAARFEIDAENWDAWRLFTACSTQWRLAGMGGRVGLDYCALQSAMGMMHLEGDPQLFELVRAAELGALAAMNATDLGALLYGEP